MFRIVIKSLNLRVKDDFSFTDEIRILNKIELCRLQGFSDDYCDILTRNKAASLLGDGWTLPIIEYILSFYKIFIFFIIFIIYLVKNILEIFVFFLNI